MGKDNKTKRNLKIYLTFVMIMLLCLSGGFVFGIVIGKHRESLNAIDWNGVSEYMAVSLPIIYIIVMAALSGISICIYFKVKREAYKWDGEEETLINEIEKKITWLSMLPAISIGLNMMFFSICLCVNESVASAPQWIFATSIITCMISVVLCCVIWKITVDLEKKLNPEKKGNPFEFYFIRKWEESSDEGEILIQAKACKKAFIIGQIICIFMWVISFICMLAFQTGVLPVICCCVIILCMYFAYGFELVKLQK